MSKKISFLKTVYIRADKLYVDPTDIDLGLQRDPYDRLTKLVEDFGEDGEKINGEIFGVILVKDDGNGRYTISDGGGRHYAIMHLLNQPSLPIPCQIGANSSKRELFRGQNRRKQVPPGTMYWSDACDPRHKYEYGIGKILRSTREGFTTVPGEPGAIKVNNAQFAHDLGVLRETLTLADVHWAGPKRKRIEGIGISGLAGFLAAYPDANKERLVHVLSSVSYDDLKTGAKDYLPPNKEHARHWGVALCKELVRRYNLGTRKLVLLEFDPIATIQTRLQDSPRFQQHSAVWHMTKIVAEGDYSETDEAIEMAA